ncbi:MAG: hypothetical protein Greene041679_298 [Parcubacteria group bacterium Greene0416_79]|nr:MAG: hypothetical protein Greene041679_298 [Parcubacteria group bacterium Greene0416_79]
MYHVRLARRAEKELAKLPQKAQHRVRASCAALSENPLLGKPLKGILAGAYSVYVWPYRIVYAPFHKEKTVIVLRVRHRKDAYR